MIYIYAQRTHILINNNILSFFYAVLSITYIFYDSFNLFIVFEFTTALSLIVFEILFIILFFKSMKVFLYIYMQSI